MKDQATALRALRETAPLWKVPAEAPVSAETGTRRSCVSIVVTSGKGGVGKTQLSVNLSIALARFGKKVILFDADMGLANIDIVLGLHPEWHLIHVLEGTCRMDDIILPGPEGVRIVPASSGVERLANLDSSVIEAFFGELRLLEESAHYLIVDTAAGISRSVLQFTATASRVIVVTTPEPAAFADAYASIKCTLRHNPRAQIGLVVNCCRTVGEGRGVFDRMRLMAMQFLKTNIEFLMELPLERHLNLAIRRQKSIMMENPNCGYSASVTALARKITGIGNPELSRKDSMVARLMAFLSKWEE